jgi:uncharacterized protein (TIGR01244 family)
MVCRLLVERVGWCTITPMMRILRLSFTIVAAGALMVVTVSAQQIVKKDIPGISTFAQLETTIACGGSTRPEAIPELGRMGFKSVINLRLASEEGAQVEDEGIAVKAAGMNYVHLPFNMQAPDPKLVDDFIAAVTLPANQPAYVHCAAGGRAAAMWMIKRVVADHWDEPRALTEANALGLNDRLRPFALNYIHSHVKQ